MFIINYNMKKYYFLINSLEWGGAERVITRIVSSKLYKKHEVTIITLKNINFYDLPKNVKHLALSNIKNNFLMFLNIPFFTFKFKKVLKKNNFDGGMSSLEIANFVNILANKKAKIAFGTTISFFSWIIGRCYKQLIKILYPKAERIKVNSEENKYLLAKYLKISEDKIDVIYNPIDLKQIDILKNEKVESELMNEMRGKEVFITTGRLISSKHHTKIITALKKIYDEWEKKRYFLILSDWPERKHLEKLVSLYGLNNFIKFLGLQKNVFKYLHQADYYLYASEIEGFPNVLIEALACDLGIITSHFRTWCEEFISGEYNENFKIKYPYYWENWVIISNENYEDDFYFVYTNRKNILKRKKWFEKFDIDVVAEQLMKFIS